MPIKSFTFHFKGGDITVRALNIVAAKILAQAKAIEKGWDYEIQEKPAFDLKALIDKKINEIFLEYQEANGIKDGGIDPFDALRLDQITEALTDLVMRVGNYQNTLYDDLALEQREQM